jgi:hypothetical protein
MASCRWGRMSQSGCPRFRAVSVRRGLEGFGAAVCTGPTADLGKPANVATDERLNPRVQSSGGHDFAGKLTSAVGMRKASLVTKGEPVERRPEWR